MKFAKIVEVDGNQVLFWFGPDPEMDEREMLHQIVRPGGMFMDVSVGGLTYAAADTLYEKIDQTMAAAALKIASDMGFTTDA